MKTFLYMGLCKKIVFTGRGEGAEKKRLNKSCTEFIERAKPPLTSRLCVSILFLCFYTVSFSLQANEMVQIPNGIYKPFLKVDLSEVQRPIPVKKFQIDKYPVTNENYLQFLVANPKWNKEKVPKIFADEGYLHHFTDSLNAEKNAPVTNISWFSAKAYCEWAKKRLPTTAEWEYVALIPPSGGNDKTVDSEIMKWYAEKKPERIPKVGRYKNRLGVYDMHGLVWEWVYDFNSSSVTGDSRADSDLESSLFCGAGALKANDFSNYAAYMRFGYRSGLKGWYTAKYLGFRCAKDL